MILQINKQYAPDIGGVERVVQDYGEILNAHEKVIVLCVSSRFSFFTKKESINGVSVYRCSSIGTFFSLPISFVFFFYLFYLSRSARLIHFHEPFPLGSLGHFLVPRSKKIFVTWHSDIVRQKFFKPFIEFFQRRLCDRADKIITTSANLAKYSHVISSYNYKLVVIPLFINIEKYVVNDFSILKDLPKDYVLFLGRLSNYKGVHQLLNAIELLPSYINFVIAGKGELSGYVRSMVTGRMCNVHFIDRFVSENEKMYLLSNCKFFVFPSILPSEAFGILQLEAMAFSKAIINTSLTSGVPWVSPHNVSGLTVPPYDIESLAQSILHLYNNPDVAHAFGINGRKRLQDNFVYTIVSDRLLSLYLYD